MTPEVAAALLTEAGLDAARIDPTETAADLDARTEMNETLDELVRDQDEPAPRFDPAW